MDKESSFPSDFQRRTLWRAVTGLAIVVIGALLVGLVWLTSSIFGYLQPVLVPLAVAGIVAYLLDPIVQWLQRKGLSRLKGIIIVFVGFVLFFLILLYYTAKPLSQQLNDALGEESGPPIPSVTPQKLQAQKQHPVYGWVVQQFFKKDRQATNTYLTEGGALTGIEKDQLWKLNPETGELVSDPPSASPELRKLMESNWDSSISLTIEKDAPTEEGKESTSESVNAENIVALHNFWLTQGGAKITSIGKGALGWLLSSSGKILGFFGIIIGFAMVPIYLYYFLKESDSIKSSWQDYVPLKASQFKTEVVDTLREINGYLISFFRGQVLVAFIDGLLVGISLEIFGLDYGLLIGIFMAFLGIIPYIGNIICLIPACIIAAIQEPAWGLPQWGYVVGVLAIFIIVQQINSLVTAPKIVGDSVGLHPMTVIFSMLFWSLLLGGFLGALLAVPLTAAVKVIFRRYVWERKIELPLNVENSESPA